MVFRINNVSIYALFYLYFNLFYVPWPFLSQPVIASHLNQLVGKFLSFLVGLQAPCRAAVVQDMRVWVGGLILQTILSHRYPDKTQQKRTILGHDGNLKSTLTIPQFTNTHAYKHFILMTIYLHHLL